MFGRKRDRVVIAGAGACGASAAETLRAEGYDGQIVMIGGEPDPPYERPLLTREFLLPPVNDATGGTGGPNSDAPIRGGPESGGAPNSDAPGSSRRTPAPAARVRSARWLADHDIELMLSTQVLGVNPQRHRVRLSTGRSMRYGKLLVATGGRPRRLPHAGSERVMYLRTRQDARDLGERLATEQRVAVLGAGFVGSEVAAAARARGIEVTMLDARDIPLQRSVGRDIARSLGEIHRSAGVEVRTGERALSVRDIPGGLLVETNRGRLECGLLLVALGMRPNTENFAAPGTGIEIRNGIVVDEFCRTSVPDVFAAGDVAEQFNPLFGRRLHVEHFDNAIRQGKHAAVNMLGRSEAGRESLWFWSDQYDYNLQSVGDLAYADEVVVRGRPDEDSFSVFHLRRGTVRAVLALNRPRDVIAGRQLVAAGARMGAAELRDPSTDLRAAARAATRAAPNSAPNPEPRSPNRPPDPLGAMGAVDLLNTVLALLGGAAVALIGTLLKVRGEARTAARLVYAELTRNGTSVAYFRRTDSWPTTTGSRTVWEEHGQSLARFRGGELFHAIHRGYAALEGVQFIAADSALAEPQRSDLIDLAVSDLLSAVRALAAVAGIPPDRLQAEVRRLSARPVGPRAAEPGVLTDSGAVPPALLATIVDRSGTDAPPSARRSADGPVECMVYDARRSELLPGTLARGWGDRPTGDPAVDDAYDILVQTSAFCHDVFGRRSIDNRGTPLTAVVHFGDCFGNTFWNGNRIIIGDGDDLVFKRFSVAPEVVVAELCNMMPEISRLGGEGQSGALGASLRDVFGLLVRQYAYGETTDDASWIIGEGLLLPGVDGEGLRSFRLPGTAYDDPILGSDPQAAHMDEYRDEERVEQREAALHRNSGIPSRAFYRAAVALGGHAWECAGAVWYRTLTDPDLTDPDLTGQGLTSPNPGRTREPYDGPLSFAAFAERTVAVADKRYGSVAMRIVRQAWTDVGVL